MFIETKKLIGQDSSNYNQRRIALRRKDTPKISS